MKTDIITLQQTTDDFTTPGQHIEYVCRRKVGVVKKRNSQIWPQRPQESRHHPQIIIMQPDHCAFRSLGGCTFSEQTIDLEEYRPVLFAKHRTLPEGMQRRPERLLGKALIEHIHIVLGQGNPRGNQICVTIAVDFGMHFECAILARVMD